MVQKVRAILGSVRFWQLAIIAVIEVLVGVAVIDGPTGEAWARGIELLLGGSVTLGTIDSFANKISR